MDSFVANPGEVRLLDVKQIHGVKPLGEFELRKAVTLGTFKHEYNSIIEMLRETGNI